MIDDNTKDKVTLNLIIGDEKDDYKATVLNVKHGVNVIKNAFHDHPDIEDG